MISWKNALNEILNKYNELLEIDIDESLFDDIYFLDVWLKLRLRLI